jgi:hypothetical protein
MYAGWRDPSRSLELATHVQPKLGGWKASNSNSKAAATITTTITDFTARVNQMDATGRVPLQSAAISTPSASHRASGGVHRGVCRPADRLLCATKPVMRFNIYQALSYLRLPLPTTNNLVQPCPCIHLWASLKSPGYVIGAIMVELKVSRLGMAGVGSVYLAIFLVLLLVIYFGVVIPPSACCL